MLDCAQEYQPLWPMPCRAPQSGSFSGETAPGHRTLSCSSGSQCLGAHRPPRSGGGGRSALPQAPGGDLWCRWASAQVSAGWVGSGCFGGYVVRKRREAPSILGDSGEKSQPLGCTKLSPLNKAAGFNSHPINNLDWPYFIFRRADLIFLPKPLCSYKVEETLYPLGVFPK